MIRSDYFTMPPKNMSLHTRLRGPIKEDTGIESRTDLYVGRLEEWAARRTAQVKFVFLDNGNLQDRNHRYLVIYDRLILI
jgi:hypothetical protein